MSNGLMRKINPQEFREKKSEEILLFLNRYSKIQWSKGKRKTRELFPDFNMISKNCKLNNQQTKVIISYLEEKGEIIRDFSQRYLKWVWDKMQEQRKKVIDLKNEKSKKTIFYNLKIISKIINDLKIVILKAIALIIGCIVVETSIYFTYIWFTTMFNSARAMRLSITIVITSIISFEFMILFFQDFIKGKGNKGNLKYLFFGSFFFLLWLGVVSFSITTGLSGQVNSEIVKKIQYEETELVDDSKILLFQNYEDRIQQLNIDIESIRKERDKLQEFIHNSNFDTTSDKKEYKDLNYRISVKNNEINKLRKQISNLEKEKESLLKENIKVNVTKKIDFFIWLENVLKINQDKSRFILYTILAVFVDLIAPINFSIVLFYKRKEM